MDQYRVAVRQPYAVAQTDPTTAPLACGVTERGEEKESIAYGQVTSASASVNVPNKSVMPDRTRTLQHGPPHRVKLECKNVASGFMKPASARAAPPEE
jgi:hypothetical protein